MSDRPNRHAPPTAATPANVAPSIDSQPDAFCLGEPEPAPSVSNVRVQQMIEEQIRPLGEQVRRLENELHAAGSDRG